MTVHQTWFGPADMPLFGVVHLPEGSTARGGVVLCPPLGMEHINSYRGMMLLAQQLCAAGLVVLRFDYPGTGDSAGKQVDADAVEHWLHSIVTAAQYLRSTGIEHLALVGLRAGALLAAVAAERCAPLVAAVLWDPVVSGRSYLRQQTAVYRMSVGGEEEQNSVVSIPAMAMAKEAAAALGGLSLGDVALQRSARDVLVALRADKRADRALRTVIEGSGAAQLHLARQDRFLEVSSQFVRIPDADITALAQWLGGRFIGEPGPVRLPPLREVAEVDRAGDGRAVVETLRRVGPDDLFAIVSSTGSAPARSLVLCSASKEHRVGPARMFVELARDLAAHDVEVLRFDRRGTGESGRVGPDELTPVYSAESAVDTRNVLAALRTAPQDTVVSGLCSGSWMAMTAAQGTGVGAAVLLSPVIWSLQTRDRKIASAQDAIDANQSPVAPDTSLRTRGKHLLRRYLPYPLWWLLGRLGVTQVPEVALRPLLRSGVAVTAVLPPADHSWFLDQRGPEGITRLGRRGLHPRLVVLTDGDHSLLHRGARRLANEHIRQVVLRGESSSPATEQ